jgi:sugar/nucleoside kinase (ribokinase family)
MIASLGELLVEFVCTETGGRHLRAAPYMGPYPSGAPGIYIDQAARIAGAAVFAGAVGADAFGQVVRDRLVAGGVRDDLIVTDPARPTGTAHVSYNPDGSRDFVFNIAHSAAASLPDAATIRAGFAAQGVTLLHVSGSALGDAAARARIMDLADGPWALSIDPNIRPELMRDAGYLDALRALVARAAHVLPSDADAALLWPGDDFATFAPRLMAAGARTVVLKRGDQGCTGTDGATTLSLPAHKVTVTDPTGAGDCFCGTFTAALHLGQPFPRALALANAAGALAVQALGPMEGNAPLDRIAALL